MPLGPEPSVLPVNYTPLSHGAAIPIALAPGTLIEVLASPAMALYHKRGGGGRFIQSWLDEATYTAPGSNASMIADFLSYLPISPLLFPILIQTTAVVVIRRKLSGFPR